MKAMTAKQVLLKAAQKIESGRWCQHFYYRGKNACPIGWVRRLTRPGTVREEALGFLVNAIGNRHICRWNDARTRTKSQVAAAFRRAAKLTSKRAEA